MTKVSVIIPVYNVEPYLARCLDSVCNQTLKDIEIICINDCSPDNSLAILEEYAQKDERIRIIDFKENKGVAIARNTGIDTAKGEYIGFVDSDDYIDLNFYEALYKKAIEENVELVLANIKECSYQDGDLYLAKIKENKINFNGLFFIGFYKKSLLELYNITFTENCTYGEDRLLPLQAAHFSASIAICPDVSYHYIYNIESVTKTKLTFKKLQDIFYSMDLLLDFIQKNLKEEDCNYLIKNYWEQIQGIYMRIDEALFPTYVKLVENFYENIIFDKIKIFLDDFYVHRHDKIYLTNFLRKKEREKTFANLRKNLKVKNTNLD